MPCRPGAEHADLAEVDAPLHRREPVAVLPLRRPRVLAQLAAPPRAVLPRPKNGKKTRGSVQQGGIHVSTFVRTLTTA